MTTVLVVHLPLLAVWVVVRDTPPLVVPFLALPAGLYLVAAAEQLSRGRVRVPRTVTSCAAAAGLMACSSTLVATSGGYVEAHFHFFVMVPVVALYEARAPFAVAVSWVLVEHGVVGTLWPQYVFGTHHEHMAQPWRFAAIHAGFFAAACVGSLTAWTLAERARHVQQGLVETLRHRTLHDDLTGLANRTHLAQALDQALAAGGPVAVLALDLDAFKEVNDTLGHSAGDQLLRAMAARAASTITTRGLVVRLGGDEFAVLLPDHDGDQAMAVAQRLRLAVARATSLDGLTHTTDTAAVTSTTSISVQVSIGVAVRSLPQAASDPTARVAAAEQMLREADVAMYHAKKAGTGTAHYDPTTDQHTVERLEGLSDFRRALDTDDQIVVHLQPKISVTTGALVGVEALARWQHPTRGLLPPSEFIAMATSPDLSETFTRRVLDAAVRCCATWLQKGYQVPVSVNITPHCLPRLADTLELEALLTARGVPASLLCLELTEDALITDPDRAAEVLTAIRATGVRVSIDDFGTGYSSLSYLRRLPFDELKIDRSFVLGLQPHGHQGPVDDVLVASIIDLGHRLGVHVVAEGVEHHNQLEVLRRLGCDSVQGYLYSPPVPADRIPTDLLATTTTPRPDVQTAVQTARMTKRRAPGAVTLQLPHPRPARPTS